VNVQLDEAVVQIPMDPLNPSSACLSINTGKLAIKNDAHEKSRRVQLDGGQASDAREMIRKKEFTLDDLIHENGMRLFRFLKRLFSLS
jgi:hypothetical protein